MSLVRLVVICLLLRVGKKLTAVELSKRFEVTLRTVYRDIETLQRVGVPIISTTGPHGGYVLDKFSDISPMLFAEEKKLIDFLISSLAIRNTSIGRVDFHKQVLQEIDKYLFLGKQKINLENEQRVLFDTQEWYWKDRSEPTLEVLKKSIFNNNKVEIEYHERDSIKKINDIVLPYGLVWKGGAWYLVCYSNYYNKFRRIRVERIKNINIIQQEFLRYSSFNLADFWKKDLEEFGKGNIKVVFKIEKSALGDFESFGWKDQGQVKKYKDYWIATLHVDRWEWLVPIILSYGGDVVALEPTELKKTIMSEITALFNSHIQGYKKNEMLKREPSDIRQRVSRGKEPLK